MGVHRPVQSLILPDCARRTADEGAKEAEGRSEWAVCEELLINGFLRRGLAHRAFDLGRSSGGM